MLLCQNAQTFNLEGSLVRTRGGGGTHSRPLPPSQLRLRPTCPLLPFELIGLKIIPSNLEYFTNYKSNMCSLLKRQKNK